MPQPQLVTRLLKPRFIVLFLLQWFLSYVSNSKQSVILCSLIQMYIKLLLCIARVNMIDKSIRYS